MFRNTSLITGLLTMFIIVALQSGTPVRASNCCPSDKEKELSVKDLPAPVKTAFKQSYPNVKIEECEVETRDGRSFYEIEFKQGDVERSVLYNAGGDLMQVEEEIGTDQLPEAVRQAVTAKYPAGVIGEAEKITAINSICYEVEVKLDGKKTEVCISPEGKLLGCEDEEDDEDDTH